MPLIRRFAAVADRLPPAVRGALSRLSPADQDALYRVCQQLALTEAVEIKSRADHQALRRLLDQREQTITALSHELDTLRIARDAARLTAAGAPAAPPPDAEPVPTPVSRI